MLNSFGDRDKSFINILVLRLADNGNVSRLLSVYWHQCVMKRRHVAQQLMGQTLPDATSGSVLSCIELSFKLQTNKMCVRHFDFEMPRTKFRGLLRQNGLEQVEADKSTLGIRERCRQVGSWYFQKVQWQKLYFTKKIIQLKLFKDYYLISRNHWR